MDSYSVLALIIVSVWGILLLTVKPGNRRMKCPSCQYQWTMKSPYTQLNPPLICPLCSTQLPKQSSKLGKLIVENEYDVILNKFLIQGNKHQRLEIVRDRISSCKREIRKRIWERQLSLKVRVLDGDLYLERMN